MKIFPLYFSIKEVNKTSTELYLTSPIPPSVNHYLGYRGLIKNGHAVAISYKTHDAVKYQSDFAKYVKDEVQKQGYSVTPNETQHFYVDCVFYFARMDKDPNNYFKCMLDAITDTQLIWLDDNVVCERVQRVYYDKKNPRVELHIYPVDYVGIFENKKQLDDFKKNCVDCSRYKRNCGLLKQAKLGYIQNEIQDCICSKFNPVKGE